MKERVKEIYVEAKRSKNFQTFTVGTLVEVSITDDVELDLTIKQFQAKVNELAQVQLK